jgi:hypothetical protein
MFIPNFIKIRPNMHPPPKSENRLKLELGLLRVKKRIIIGGQSKIYRLPIVVGSFLGGGTIFVLLEANVALVISFAVLMTIQMSL